MASAVNVEGRVFATYPDTFRHPALPIAWAAFVAIAGAVLTGHVAGASLLALAVVAGLTHGTTDVSVARRGLRRFGRWRCIPFLMGYLGLIGMTLAAWAWTPTAMLAIFLLLSTIHFGIQDAGETSGSVDWAAVFAHGAAPIVVPAFVHPDEVVRLFATLVGNQAEAVQAIVAGPVAGIWALAVIVTGAVTVGRRDGPGGAAWTALADLALVCLLFAVASPLVAFALYFALLHTPRAFAAQREKADAIPAVQMVGLTVLACVLALGIYRFGSGLTVDDGIVRTSFMLLGALTVPHMALDWLAHGSGNEEKSVADRLPLP